MGGNTHSARTPPALVKGLEPNEPAKKRKMICVCVRVCISRQSGMSVGHVATDQALNVLGSWRDGLPDGDCVALRWLV